MRREIPRRIHDSLIDQVGEDRDIFKRRLAGEKERKELHFPFSDGEFDELVQKDKAPAVREILGEGSVGRSAPPEDSGGLIVRGILVEALIAEKLEDIKEGRSLFGKLHRADAIGDAMHTLAMAGESDEFHEHRKPLLRDSGGGGAFAEEAADLLAGAIKSGGDMDPTFVDFQQAEIAFVEVAVFAKLDVVAAGGGVGDDAITDDHADAMLWILEIVVELGLQDLDRVFTGDGSRILLTELDPVESLEHLGHHDAEVGHRGVTLMEDIA